MNEGACWFCLVVEGLRYNDYYQSPSGEVIRKIYDLPAAFAILDNDQYYPGYTLVVAKTHADELYQLSEKESTQFCQDMLRVARAIATVFQPQKMNYELLGNTVSHLHWHLFPRYGWDPNPRRPIWEHKHDRKLLSVKEYTDRIASIQRALQCQIDVR